MGKKLKPTLRQRRLMRNLLAGQKFTQAAIHSGYSTVTVAKKGRRLLRPDQWAELLNLAGLDDDTLGKRLLELCHATSRKFFHGRVHMSCCGRPWEGCTCEKKGRLTDAIIASPEFIDWDARARGLDMALRIREAYREKQQTPLGFGVETDGGPVRVVVKWPESCPRAQPGCAGTPRIRPAALQGPATGDTVKRKNAGRRKALRSASPQDELG